MSPNEAVVGHEHGHDLVVDCGKSGASEQLVSIVLGIEEADVSTIDPDRNWSSCKKRVNAHLSFVIYMHDWYVRPLDDGAKSRNFGTTLPIDS
jgi:hypothetical protein